MNQLKNVICSRCGIIYQETEIRKDEFGRYWDCDNCGARRRITSDTGKQPVQRTTWLIIDGKADGRWAKWDPDTGQVIEISKDGEPFPDVAVFQQPKRHGIIGMHG